MPCLAHKSATLPTTILRFHCETRCRNWDFFYYQPLLLHRREAKDQEISTTSSVPKVGCFSKLALGSARRVCAVGGFVVTLSDDGRAPVTLYREQWSAKEVAESRRFEVIFLEEGFDAVSNHEHMTRSSPREE